jgi:phage terminase small subunit
MAKRGKKLSTAKNSLPGSSGRIHRKSIDPPSTLSPEAQIEYQRLCEVLESRGTLDRIDLAVVAECARIKDLLDRVQKLCGIGIDSKMISTACQLTSQRRGLLREMGLSIQPSRSVIRSDMQVPGKQSEPLAKLVKLADVS